MTDAQCKGEPGFAEIRYKGKPLKGFKGTMRTIVMQKNNPDQLDMRYKTNREFIKEQRAWTQKVTGITPV